MTKQDELRTMFAETAILLTHSDDKQKALAKERIYALLYPADAKENGRASDPTEA